MFNLLVFDLLTFIRPFNIWPFGIRPFNIRPFCSRSPKNFLAHHHHHHCRENASARSITLALFFLCEKKWFAFVFYNFPTLDWFNNHLKHLGRARLGLIIIWPVGLWHHFHLVYRWWGSNQRPFNHELSSLPTRSQLTFSFGLTAWASYAIKVIQRY